MLDTTLQALKDHAAKEAPFECCGYVILIDGLETYWPCRNMAEKPEEQFVMNAEDSAAAEDTGTLLKVCHSHVFANPEASAADRSMCEMSGLPWVIVNHPVGTVYEFGPEGFRAPLLQRQFVHGIHDCYALIRDYYAWELNICLPDFPRQGEWWLKNQDLYRKYFTEAGFSVAKDTTLKEHDVIIMQIRSPVWNHGAIYIGQNKIMHHLQDRLSGRTVYGGYWQDVTVAVLRHRRFT